MNFKITKSLNNKEKIYIKVILHLKKIITNTILKYITVLTSGQMIDVRMAISPPLDVPTIPTPSLITRGKLSSHFIALCAT